MPVFHIVFNPCTSLSCVNWYNYTILCMYLKFCWLYQTEVYFITNSKKFLMQGHHVSFSNVPISLIRTFSMMLGEIDFLGTYVQPYYHEKKDSEKTLPYPIPAFLILGLFMVLMPILLMNLLIGLAVGDIESVRRNAQLKRLAMQVRKICQWQLS